MPIHPMVRPASSIRDRRRGGLLWSTPWFTRRARYLAMAIAILVGALHSRAAVPHPHIWVDALVVVESRDGMIHGFDVTYVFDAFYSMLVIEDFDDTRDGTLNADELTVLETEIRENLSYVEFFAHIHVDGTPIRVDGVDSIHADLRDDDIIAISFRVTLPLPVDPRHSEFEFALYDDTHYVAIMLDEFEPVQIAGELPQPCRFDLQPAAESSRYEGIGGLFAQYARAVCDG